VFKDPKIQDKVNRALWDLQSIDKEKQEVEEKISAVESKENVYDIWGESIDLEEITRKLIKKYAGQDGYDAITSNPEDNPATSTTQDQGNQPPVRSVDRTPSGYILSNQDKTEQVPLRIELKNQKFDVEIFDKKIDVLIRELVPVDVSRLSDRVETELMTLEEQLAALQGQLDDKDDELGRLNDQLEGLTGQDDQVYPDGTILTIPEKTWSYIVHKGKLRFIPDIFVQDNTYSAQQSGYPITVTQPVTGKSLLETILNAYQGSIKTVTLDDLRLMDEGYVTEYIVNPTRDTVTIKIPDQPQPYTVNLGLSYDENGNVELDEDGYPIERTKVEMGPADPVKIGSTPPSQTVNIGTQSGAAAAAETAAINNADAIATLQAEIVEIETRMGELNARMIQAIDDTGFNDTNTGIWKARVNNGEYSNFVDGNGDLQSGSAVRRISKNYRQAGYGPDSEDSLQEVSNISIVLKTDLANKQSELAGLQ